MYKTAYDVLTQVTIISKNVSKNCQVPFGVRLKELAYEACKCVGSVYDVKGEERRVLIERALPMCEELCFLLQFLKDMKEISLNSFSMLSEKIQSVSKQLFHHPRPCPEGNLRGIVPRQNHPPLSVQ